MAKKYRASIVLTLEPDDEGYLDWQDREDDPMTEDKMFRFARQELAEIIVNAVKYGTESEIIEVEVIEED